MISVLFGNLFPGEGFCRVIFMSMLVDAVILLYYVQVFGNIQGILDVSIHTKRQGLYPLQDQETVER